MRGHYPHPWCEYRGTQYYREAVLGILRSGQPARDLLPEVLFRSVAYRLMNKVGSLLVSSVAEPPPSPFAAPALVPVFPFWWLPLLLILVPALI